MIEGDRWPGATVSVWNGTGYVRAVGDAMRSWNAAGAAVRLVPARGLGRPAAAAHELGHVLGLAHEERRCSVMAPVVSVGSASRCGIGVCVALLRCLVRPGDAAGLRALDERATAS